MPSSSDSLRPQPVNPNPAIVSGITRLPTDQSAEGVDLDELPIGAVLEIETGHTTYRLEYKGDGNAVLSGHPKYCPEPTAVQIHGSLSAAGELKWRYVGKGMKLAFLPPEHGVVRTSTIKSIRHLKTGHRLNAGLHN